jgi:hypothetical protein
MNSRLAGFSTYSDGKIDPSSFHAKKTERCLQPPAPPHGQAVPGEFPWASWRPSKYTWISGLNLQKSTKKTGIQRDGFCDWHGTSFMNHGTIAYHSTTWPRNFDILVSCAWTIMILFRKALIMSGHFHQQKIKQQLGESILLLQLLIFEGPWQVNLGPCRTIAWFTPQKIRCGKWCFSWENAKKSIGHFQSFYEKNHYSWRFT